MQNRKAYIATRFCERAMSYGGYEAIYLCRGRCADHMRLAGLRVNKNSITEVDLYYEDDAEFTDKPAFTDRIGVFYIRDTKTGKIGPWFTGAVAEKMTAKLSDDQMIEHGTCDVIVIEPVIHENAELVDSFKQGKDGRLFTQLNLHPEWDGYMTGGKIFFPDRSFQNASPGRAVLNLTTVKEFDTYGFIGGHMFRYDEFDRERFLDYVYLENTFPNDTPVEIYEGELGTYAVVGNRHSTKQTHVYFVNGKLATESVSRAYSLSGNPSDKLLKRGTTGVMLLESRFGEIQGEAKSMLDEFIPAKCEQQRFNICWQSRDVAAHNNLLADGVAQHFLACKELPGYNIIIYTMDDAVEAIAFSDKELAEMRDQFNEVNQAADAKVMALLKKQRLKIEPKSGFTFRKNIKQGEMSNAE